MFKAVNSQNGKHIIILNPEWKDNDNIDCLRSLGRKDDLVCQRCGQPVRVRAGTHRKWHFAHKQIKDCPLQNESSALLSARAILYEWLIGKFCPSIVTLEKEIKQISLKRPVDCFVENKSHKIAYWIVDSQIKPLQREEMKRGFERLSIQVNWIFLHKMMNVNDEEPGQLFLSTTEREFMHSSEYSCIDQDFENKNPLFSIHYINCENGFLTSFRTLNAIHGPQLYSGCRKEHHISEILVLGKKTGELIHPGEYEQLQQWKQSKIEYERVRDEAINRLKKEAEKKKEGQLEKQKRWSCHWKELNQLHGHGLQQAKRKHAIDIHLERDGNVYSQNLLEFKKEAECELCGNLTTHWYYFNGKTNTCKCMECYRRSCE